MRLLNRAGLITPWLGVLLGICITSSPLAALAVEFKPPSRGVPGRREGGGTRDPLACTQGNPSRLTALIPATNLGLTTTGYPRFFWFIPKTRAKFAEFTLFEVNEQLTDQTPVYQTTFSLANTPGIASLSLPNTATIPPLVVGKDYRWSVVLICNPNDRQRDIKVTGLVQRVTPEPTLTNQLTQAKPSDRPKFYANSGIWFDTVAALADLRCANSKDPALTTSWAELLKSVNLTAIVEQPLYCAQEGASRK